MLLHTCAILLSHDCSGKQIFCFCFVTNFWPNPGPGCLQLGSGRPDVEFACVFASVAPWTVSFVSECIFWNLVDKKTNTRAMAGYYMTDNHKISRQIQWGQVPGHENRQNTLKTKPGKKKTTNQNWQSHIGCPCLAYRYTET